MSSDNTGQAMAGSRDSTRGFRRRESGDFKYCVLSALAVRHSCRSEQWVRETMGGEKSVSVHLPRDSGVSESLQRILQLVIGDVSVDFASGYIGMIERPLHQQ